MRQYVLSDRDFEEFLCLIEKIEAENRLKHGHQVRTSPCPECDLQAMYRYYFIQWRNRVMSGDSYSRGIEPPRDDNARYIRAEIERLTRLLPKE